MNRAPINQIGAKKKPNNVVVQAGPIPSMPQDQSILSFSLIPETSENNTLNNDVCSFVVASIPSSSVSIVSIPSAEPSSENRLRLQRTTLRRTWATRADDGSVAVDSVLEFSSGSCTCTCFGHTFGKVEADASLLLRELPVNVITKPGRGDGSVEREGVGNLASKMMTLGFGDMPLLSSRRSS